MITGRAVTAAIVGAAIAGHAIAAPAATEAERLYDEGVRFYNLARYDEAADAFQHAYLLSGQPGLLFNIAQAFRQGKHCEDALKFYRSYLRAQPDSPARESVEHRIAEMEACANAGVVPPAAPAPAPAPEASQSRLWVWTLGAAALGFGATGTVLMVSTSSSLDACSPRCSPDRIDHLRLRADAGYGAFAVAGVALLGAAWLWVRDPDGDHPPPSRGLSINGSSISLWSTF